MIQCKPKSSTYFSLGMVLIILISGLVFLLNDFATKRSYGLVFYLIGCSFLTVVLLLLLVKMMAGYKFVSAGKDNISIRLPIRGFSKTYSLSQVLVWEEERIMANKKEFRQLTIVFDDKNSIAISNHEHENYQEFFEFMNRKISKKNINKKA